MQTQQFAYPFDPNGTAPSNKVVGERHTITPVNGSDFRFIVPRAAPYFRNSLVVTHIASGRVLQDGIDYQPGHRFDAASNTAPYLAIFGSILIMDNTLEGTIEVEYQTLGGEFTIDETIALQIMANAQLDPRMTKWDLVLNAPGTYDPLLHRQNVQDFVGWDDAVVAINRLVDAVLEKIENSNSEDPVARSHIANRNNPHEVRLAQLPDGAHLTNLTATNVDYLLNQARAGGLLQLVDIAENADEETALRALPTESFAEVFATWERVAWQNNNPQAIPAELDTWSFDAVNNQLVSTTNSVSMVGFISPSTVSGDYVFEVELESNNNDDDVIGLFLGKAVINGKLRNLCAVRTASVGGASVRLTYDYSGDNTSYLATSTDLLEYPNGWNGYKQRGVIKLFVQRVGSVITVKTTDPGTAYLGSAQLTYDLNNRAELAPFVGPVNLGYIAASQAGARFKTIRRTGSKRPLANLASRKYYEYDGATYVEVTAKTFAESMPKSLFYYTKHYGRLYYSEQAGSLTKLSTSNGGGQSTPTQPTTNQLKAGDYFVPDNSAGPATYLMPATPEDLATVEWLEGPVSFATNKLVLQNTDKPIMGLVEPLEITTEGAGGKLVYFDALGYWKLYLNTQAGKIGGSSQVNQAINIPVITSPTDEQSGVSSNFTMTSTSFGTTPALADTLQHHEWQIAADSAFNNLLWMGTSSGNTVSPNGNIPPGTRVYLRTRFVGRTYGPGRWSNTVSFVTQAIAGPTTVSITGTQLASGGVTHQFTVTSSVWAGQGTHVASQFQVLTTGGTVVYDSAELAGAIVSHKPFDFGFRPTNLTNYVAKVRYKLASGQWTDYTTSTLTTGNGTFTASITTYNTSYVTSWTYNRYTAWYTYGGGNDPFGMGPGPYHYCYGDSSVGGPEASVEWVCDPGNPTAGAPPEFNGQNLGVSSTFPRTSLVTQAITTFNTTTSTSRSTQKWTEW